MRKVISDIEDKLKENEYKLTSRRELILKVLMENSDKHLSAEEVHNLVRKIAPDTGLATIYRTLELFLDLDIIYAMDFGDGRKRYEFGWKTDQKCHHHHHLVCTECGSIIEVNEDLLDELENRVSLQYGFTIKDHHLKIFGICRKCKNSL